MADTYATFADLKDAEYENSFRIQVIARSSPVAVLAPHGGGIEPGTSEIALAIAGGDFSCYLFEGLKVSGNRTLHVTSSRFDEPSCIALLGTAQFAVTVHGERGVGEFVYVGGAHDGCVQSVIAAFSAARFPAGMHKDIALQGRHPSNICNLAKGGPGIQLEISRGLRDRLIQSLRDDRADPKQTAMSRFVCAVRLGISKY